MGAWDHSPFSVNGPTDTKGVKKGSGISDRRLTAYCGARRSALNYLAINGKTYKSEADYVKKERKGE